MTCRAVVFDLDGTLADTLDAIAVTMNGVLREFGLPEHPHDAYRLFIGDGVNKLVERTLPADKLHMADEVVTAYRPRLAREGTALSKLYPGVAEMLDGVTARAIPMAVLTNKPRDATLGVMKALFSRWRFAAVQGHVDNDPVKPDPRKLLTILESMNVAPAEAMYVGDSNVDMQLAHNAGVTAIGAAWGMRGHAELEKHGADHILRQPADLLPLLDAAQ